jgi:hypothetical protein
VMFVPKPSNLPARPCQVNTCGISWYVCPAPTCMHAGMTHIKTHKQSQLPQHQYANTVIKDLTET